MRPILLTVPALGLVLCSAGLICLANIAKSREPWSPADEPRHPVTQEMVSLTESMAGKAAASFESVDARGKPVSIAPRGQRKPQFVYFILDGCPCSVAAEPLFQALAKQFSGAVGFIGVSNVDAQQTRQWIAQMHTPYPVIPDPHLTVIHAYRAKSSAYSALIGVDGRIVKMWPGFSLDYLLDMNHVLAETAGVAERPFDTLYAPLKPATGCTF